MIPTSKYNTTRQLLEAEYPNFLAYVPEVFLDDPPVPYYISFTVAFIFLSLMVVSVCGNSLMVYVYIRYQDVRTPGNKLVINLAVSDMIMHIKSWVLVFNGFHGGPFLGGTGCKLFASFGTGSGLGVIWTITALSFERCQAISSPIATAKLLSDNKANLILIGIWALAAFVTSLPMVGIGNYVSEPYLLSCSPFDAWSKDIENVVYIGVSIVAAWLAPLIVIGVCYFRIMKYTRGTKKLVRQATASDHETSQDSRTDSKPTVQKESAERMTERAVAIRLLTIIIVWIAAWTPFCMILVLQMFGYYYLVPNTVAIVAMTICKVSSVINSFLYGYRLPKFRCRIVPIVRKFQFWKSNDVLQAGPGARQGGPRRPYVVGERYDSMNMATVESVGFATSAIIRDQKRFAFRQESSKMSSTDHADVEVQAECHQPAKKLKEPDQKRAASMIKKSQTFNYKVLERKATAVIGLGNKNRLYYYKQLCNITVSWDSPEYRRRVSI